MQKNIVISINGQEGSGKSTIAQKISSQLAIPRFYMGQMFRDMANEKGLTLPEFRKICDNNPEFDKIVDDYVIALPKKHPAFVIESRTAWHFIPQSFKIYLRVDSKVASERIFKELSEKNNRSNEDSKLNNIEEIEKSILKRRADDNQRYFSLYGIHQDDEKNYDFVLDTTNLTINSVFKEIIRAINEKFN